MRNDERSVINFKEIFSLIFRRLWLIILFAVCGGIIAFCVSKYLISPKYESHIKLYVQGDSPMLANGGAAGNEGNDVNNLKQLTNTYIEVLNDDLVMQEIGTNLVTRFGRDIISKVFTVNEENNIPANELRDTIFIESVPDTLVLNVQVITKDPEVSVAICNYFALYSDLYLQKAIGTGCKAQYMSWAKYNGTPVSPDKMKNTAIGAVSAVLFALLLIFLMDFFDDSVRDVNALSNRYDRAVIGEVGRFKSKSKKGDKKGGFVSLFDKYVPLRIVENYKAIRTSIIYTLQSYDKKVISVSSAEPFEGKSITAANIAITLAQGGNKVLLIDADLRTPVQHEIFRMREKNGLANALTRISDLDSCIKKTFMDKLDIITAGDAVSNPSELVSSENMDMIIERLEDRYNYIIIDTPAVNFFTDAVEVAKKVSGMVMVVRYNETSSADIDSAMSRIEFFEANMLGFILNDVKNNKKYNKFVAPNRNVTSSAKRTDAQMMNRNNSSYRSNNGSRNRSVNNNRPRR
ncbi:polysaccharide biosynthesis tyrosine autokinase [Ruminococcus flavefaciens]|uniref:Capsular exopolysaccharide family n=1 Tax=Ruminococcus flavefaciens TaxID=1265 RepID=A0A1M7JZW8_RUMFL|nr:polysaccharide biosynthesis tyrosine autokinase [Ruminococcus flavefaciens]SHM58569.1 capsular exopolysaccharide family [Ruminococcus flavefaciens]